VNFVDIWQFLLGACELIYIFVGKETKKNDLIPKHKAPLYKTQIARATGRPYLVHPWNTIATKCYTKKKNAKGGQKLADTHKRQINTKMEIRCGNLGRLLCSSGRHVARPHLFWP